MITVISQRAKSLIQSPRAFRSSFEEGMRRFPDDRLNLWVGLEWQGINVKKLSFHGEVSEGEKALLESMASLMDGKVISKLDSLSVRECEAFLRDRNSQPALEGITEDVEKIFKKLFQWVRSWPLPVAAKEYHFHSEQRPFRTLKLVEKIKELKGFLTSPEILGLYEGMARPELVDVEDLTVYIQVPYETEREKSLFEELHLLGVAAFQEENLNFIPEA